MRLQSAIEFLTTYSFLFLMLALVVSFILIVASAPTSSIPSQCSAFAGPTCNLAEVYTNTTAGYSLVTFSITNSQGVPLNVSNTIVTLHGNSYTGACTPYFMYPGQSSTCTVKAGSTLSLTALVQGSYVLNAQFCNSGISYLSLANCSFASTTYTGSFATTPVRTRSIIFSVSAMQAPTNLGLLSFNAIKIVPTVPRNFTILQNGVFTSNVTNGNVVYAFATNGVMLGVSYYGIKTGSYPAFLSALQNGGVACSSPYNSLISVASTTLYISATTTSTVNIETGGAMEVFYKVAATGTVWQNVFTGSAWRSQSAAPYSGSISFSPGLYNIEAIWSNPCGSGGQVLQLTSIPK